MEGVISHIYNQRGKKLYFEQWLPKDPKAIIVLVHGLCDHSRRYEPFKKHFFDRGYGIFCYDHQGQGKSAGKKGHISKFMHFVNDLSYFIHNVKDKVSERPIFIVAHSMGGLVAVNYGIRHMKSVAGIVLCSSAIKPFIKFPDWKIKIAPYVSKFVPIATIQSTTDPKDLTHDEKEVEYYTNDPYVHHRVTIRLVQELLDNIKEVDKKIKMFSAPVLILHGNRDKVCDIEGSEYLYNMIPVANKELKIYDGMYHELLNEIGKERVFADIQGWIEKQMIS
ncbi:lysophospholipase [bacterium]|nr:lysophospholipase [bacterium]